MISHEFQMSGLKGFNKTKNIESESKYDSCFYNIKKVYDFKKRGTKSERTTKTFHHIMSSMEKKLPTEVKLSSEIVISRMVQS